MLPSAMLTPNVTIDENVQPGLTWKVDWDKKRIVGDCDEIESLQQAVYIILNVERYDWIIHSWNFGSELKDLFGMPIPWVQSELKRRIKEALSMDDRIEDVAQFSFETGRESIHVSFTVYSVYGTFQSGMEVNA